jgi:hypothetical protein
VDSTVAEVLPGRQQTTIDEIDDLGLSAGRPVHATMARIAATVRATSVAVAVPSGLLAVAPPASMRWLLPAAVLLTGWTAVYAWVSWTRGLRAWIITVDVVLMCGLAMMSSRLVGEPALASGWGWVTQVASMVVVCAQLAGRPVLSVPAGLVVAGSVAAGLHTAGAPPDAVANIGITVATQAAVSAVVTAVVLHAGRAASSTFAELGRTQREAQIGLARRADELTQFRLLHNGPLTTLSMALNAHDGSSSDLLRRRAAADLDALPRLASAADAPAGGQRLDERVAQAVTWYQPTLTVSAMLPPCPVPVEVADAFAHAVAEVLENVVRHAQVGRAEVVLEERDGLVRVTVADRGRGFDPADVPAQRFGLRTAVVGAMTLVGGTATVRSTPGQGSTLVLEWRRE